MNASRDAHGDHTPAAAGRVEPEPPSGAQRDRVDIDGLLRRAIETIENAPGIPMSASVRVNRDELLDLIYDDFRDVSDRTIDSHVKNVRRKLEQAAPGRTLIHSVYGVGYKLEYD